MSSWYKNKKSIISDDNKMIYCDTCPCEKWHIYDHYIIVEQDSVLQCILAFRTASKYPSFVNTPSEFWCTKPAPYNAGDLMACHDYEDTIPSMLTGTYYYVSGPYDTECEAALALQEYESEFPEPEWFSYSMDCDDGDGNIITLPTSYHFTNIADSQDRDNSGKCICSDCTTPTSTTTESTTTETTESTTTDTTDTTTESTETTTGTTESTTTESTTTESTTTGTTTAASTTTPTSTTTESTTTSSSTTTESTTTPTTTTESTTTESTTTESTTTASTTTGTTTTTWSGPGYYKWGVRVYYELDCTDLLNVDGYWCGYVGSIGGYYESCVNYPTNPAWKSAYRFLVSGPYATSTECNSS